MKSEEQSTTQIASLGFQQADLQKNSINAIDDRKPRCPSNNQASLICLNPKCQGLKNSKDEKLPNGQTNNNQNSSQKKNIFICLDFQCKSCYRQQQLKAFGQVDFKKQKKHHKVIGVHAKCFVGDYQSLINFIQEKKKQSEPLKNSIHQLFDNLIDQISNLRDKYIQKLNYYGLTQNEQKFLSYFQKKTYDQLTSTLCFQIVKELDNEMTVNCNTAKVKLEEFWQKEQVKIKKSLQSIDKILIKEYTSTGFPFEIDSKIVVEDKEKQNLAQMLESQENKFIQSINLLYRASENNFDTKAFHQNCDLRPNTVTVLETEFGRKIGGYTPLVWEKTLANRTDKDPSKKSFLFSLTNNHKFTLKQNHQAAILQYSTAGPTFGSGPSDIYIKDKANCVKIYGNIGNTYVNQEYNCGDQKSWTKFSGAIQGRDFKVKEWQVFQVKWAEKF